MKITKEYLKKMILQEIRATEPEATSSSRHITQIEPDSVDSLRMRSNDPFKVAAQGASQSEIKNFMNKILIFAKHHEKNGVNYSKVKELTNYLVDEISKAGNVPE